MSDPSPAPLSQLDLYCFGPPTARVDGQEPEPSVIWKKNLALLIYLALSDGPRPRETLLGLLWPDKPQERARGSLNEALRRLRHALGSERLRSTADTIELSHDNLTVDVLAFQAHIESDPVVAASLPRGEFLEGFSLSDAPEFDDWASRRRSTLHQQWANALLAQAESALSSSNSIQARESAERALGLLPYFQPAIGVVVRAAALAGDTAGAVGAYQDFADRLREEIGQEPASELQKLVQRVESGGWRTTFSKYPELEPPLLGRADLHARAFDTVAKALDGITQSISITSEPGAGKTRLLKECCDRFALGGGTTAIARPLESDQDQPWSTLRLVVRTGLVDAPGLTATDPDALSNIAGLVPELSTRFTPVDAVDHAQVASSLANMLTAIAEEQPLIIAIDDAHTADATSLEVLSAAVAQLEGVPLLLAFTSHESDPHASAELARMRSVIGRELPGTAVRLKALDPEDLAELTGHLAPWARTEEDRDRLTRRLTFETRGNPFLAVTILRGLADSPTFKGDMLEWPPRNDTLDSPLPFTMPDLLRMSVAARTSAMDRDTLDVLRVASIASRRIDPAAIAAIREVDEEHVLERLDELERHQFITFDGSRYSFVAPMLAEIVQAECLTRGKRQRLRSQVADALAEMDDLESRGLRAELLVLTEGSAERVREALAVAQEAADNGALRLAKRLVTTSGDVVEDPEIRDSIEKLRLAIEKK